nr:hypothetical protein [Variovorax paradoxus]
MASMIVGETFCQRNDAFDQDRLSGCRSIRIMQPKDNVHGDNKT